MSRDCPRGAWARLACLSSLLSPACAPERDVVATEFVPVGTGGAGGSAGATAALSPCQKLLTDPLPAIALYDFEIAAGAAEVFDLVAQRPATISGTPAAVTLGPDGCGNALQFGNAERYMQLPDADDWTLPVGSIDAWFWVPASIASPLGLISRDAYGDQIGHFSAWLLPDRTVMARLQQSAQGAPAPLLNLSCSAAPLPASAWAHFGFNFGPSGASLYVNGLPATRTGAPGIELGGVMCGATVPSASIPDLPLPWVVGASIYASMDVPNARQFPFVGGAIDNLRISAAEREFSSGF